MILGYWLLENSVFSSYFVPLYMGLVLEIWASSSFLLWNFRRKRYGALRIALGAMAMVGIAIGLGFLRKLAPDSLALRMGCSFTLYAVVLASIFLSFDEKPIEILLVWIAIMAVRESADGVDTLAKIVFNVPHNIMGYIEGGSFFVNGLIFDLTHLAVQVPLGLIFAKFKGSSRDSEIVFRTVTLSLILMLFSIVIKAVVLQYSSESKALYAACVSLTLLLSIMTLLLRTDALIGSQKSREIATMNAVLESEQRQFEESKQSIALINAKVHDIKHRIDDFGDKVAADTLDELKASIEIYDRPFHTGSQVLDTILYSKSLEAESLGIRLSAIGDATPLHFIESSKRFYLFSNIIDNAIEATREVKNEEKRVIGIALRKENEIFIIEEYNYFEGTRDLQNGTLNTTKKDTKQRHGLGLKSIKAFAEEYHGKVEISIKRDMFFLTVSLPIKEKDL
ncbi:MAG: ATP-binding protein [Bacilli bacterium]|nr:ATP-binding protein [Bacilli bacterium]